MMPRNQELVDRGLSCVVSAGWLPGLTELLPAYAARLAKNSMDAIQSLTVYCGDDGEWSDNALHDALWYVRKFGRRRPRYMHEGKWVRARLSEVLVENDFEAPLGRSLCTMSCLPEMHEVISREFAGCNACVYTYLPARSTAAIGSLIALLPIPSNLALRMLRRALRAPSLSVGGFSIVEIRGSRGAAPVLHRHGLTFDKQGEYWMSGVVAATVARLILQGQIVKPGVHFLAGAVDPLAFVQELRLSGVALRSVL